MRLHSVQADQVDPTPWANGLGRTRELFVAPEPHWPWRLSLAESVGSARFSHFSGVHRLLTLVSGDWLTLAFEDGETRTLTGPGESLRFDGDRPVTGSPGPHGTQQLNLMWRPERVHVESALFGPGTARLPEPGPPRRAAPLPAVATRLWFVISGWARIQDEHCDAGTALLATELADGEGPEVQCTGLLREFTIQPADF